jgi:hypothetical protein
LKPALPALQKYKAEKGNVFKVRKFTMVPVIVEKKKYTDILELPCPKGLRIELKEIF